MSKLVFITGPMFCGKTEELLRLAKRYEIANKKILVFKPGIDIRYGDDVICSHNKKARTAISIKKFDDIFPYIFNSYQKVDAIFIDEIQFVEEITFDKIKYITEDVGIPIYSAGLTLDSFRVPFPNVMALLPWAEIKQLESVCTFCDSFSAKYTYRLSTKDNQILVGGIEEYCAICSTCLKKKESYEK